MQGFKNGDTALFIFQSLRAYDLSYDDINFDGYDIHTVWYYFLKYQKYTKINH